MEIEEESIQLQKCFSFPLVSASLALCSHEGIGLLLWWVVLLAVWNGLLCCVGTYECADNGVAGRTMLLADAAC